VAGASEERRGKNRETLRTASAPVTGAALASILGVSRQAIVNDIAVLRASGAPIVGSPSGYLVTDGAGSNAVIACKHGQEHARAELEILIDHGITVVDVVVEHALYGEVRGSGDFRKVLRGMLGGIWVTAGLAIVFVVLAARTFGWLFFNATNVNYINYAYSYSTVAPTVPIWSYPPLLVSYLVNNSIFQIVFVLLFGVWFLGWSGTLFLSSTRMIFAAAFDRILPDHAAAVSERRAVPIMALLYIMIPSIVLSVIYAYSADFFKLTLDATLVIAVTFLGSAIAATILPWYKPRIFDNSPVAHLKLVVSGAGLITSIILGWTVWAWLWDANGLYGIGIGNTTSIIFLGVLYGLAAIVYIVARVVRSRQGIDLDAIHSEIPAE